MKTTTSRSLLQILKAIPVALALATPAAWGSIVFTNWTGPISTNWLCPTGVTSVTVEVWGGGGSGGGWTNTSSSVQRDASGGGGGAYAKKNSIAVTPGNTYAIYIAPPAGGGIATGGSGAANNGTNGAAVGFTNEFGTYILANGGNGGAGAYGANAAGNSSGGAATTIGSGNGQADASYAGGAGILGNGGSTTHGAGGSGASDTGNGNTSTSLTGGTAPMGSDTAHTGGKGGGDRTNKDASAPGGGGGGAGGLGANTGAIGGAGGAGRIIISWVVNSGNVVKANDSDALNLGSSWVGGVPPTSAQIAQYDNTITAGITNSLGANTNWTGILVTNVGGPVVISNDGNTLTLTSSGIDMSGALNNLTLNCPLALSVAQNFIVTNGQTLTLNGSVSGPGIVMQGAGSLVLATNNTVSGGLTVSGTATLSGTNAFNSLTVNGGATVQLGSTSALTNAPAVTDNNGTIQLNGTSQTFSSLAGSGTVNSSSGTPTLTINDAASCQFDGVIQNSGGTMSLTKGGAGMLTLTGGNGYGGNTTINGGTVVAANGSALGSGTITVSNSALGLLVSGSVNLANPIIIGTTTGVAAQGVIHAKDGSETVSSPITITGAPANGALFGAASGATLLVSGAITSSVPVSTRTGVVQFSNLNSSYTNVNVGGTLQLGAANVIPTASVVTLGVLVGGTLDLNGYNQTLSGVVKGASFNGTVINSVIGTPATLTLTGSNTCACAINDTGAGELSLTVTNGGYVTLTKTNTYSGATTISLGRLEGQVGGSCSNSAVTVANTGVLGVSVTDNTKQWACASLTTEGSGSGLNFDFGSITPSTTLAPLLVRGALTINGSVPTVTITGTSLPTGASYPLISFGSYSVDPSTVNLVLPPGVNGTLSLDGTGTILMLTVNVTVTQPVFWATNSGAWNLSSVNWLDSSTPTQNNVAYADPYTVVLEDTYSVGSGPIAVTLNTTVNPTAVTNNSAKNWSISGTGAIAGAGKLTMAGAGTFTLATTNAYTGGTIISAGVLEADASKALGTGLVTLNGGGLSNNVSATLSNTVNLTVASVIGVGGSQTLTLAGVITNVNGALTKVGNGTLVLATNSTYTNGTTLSAGTLSVHGTIAAGTNTIASGATFSFDQGSAVPNSAITFTGTGTLRFTVTNALNWSTGKQYVSLGQGGLVWVTGTGGGNVDVGWAGNGYWTNNQAGLLVDAGCNFNLDETGGANTWAQFDGLNGGGTIEEGYGTTRSFIVGVANGSGTFSGILYNYTNTAGVGALALVKQGTGTQTLTGTNTYTGSTTISAGTLAISGNGSIGNTSAIIVAGGATFDVSAKATTFTLGSSRTLTNSSVGAIVNGTNDCSTGTISLVYDATNACFTITNGGMTLAAGTTFKVNNSGPALGVGSYKVIARATSGNVGLVAGAVPGAVALSGNARVPNVTAQPLLRIGGGELYLDVPPAPPSVANNGPITAGATLLLTATNASGGTYAWTGPNGFTSALQNPSIVGATTAASGTYNCTVTVNGVTSATATTTVTVNPGVSTPATISSVRVDGSGNLIITGTNGSANGTYSVLTSTNLTAPLSTWVTNTTGSFTGSGSFSNSIAPSGTEVQRYFNIKQP